MSERWPPLPEFLGLAVGSLFVVLLAIGVIFLAQSLGASDRLLVAIAGLTMLTAGVIIGKALN